jgi:hypothetical protein
MVRLFLNELVKPFHRLTLNRRELGRLAELNLPEAQNLARAILRTRKEEASEEEKAWIGKIEEVRRRMNSSNETVTMEDFGAGASTSRSVQAGGAPKTYSRSISELSRSSSKSSFWCRFLFNLLRACQPASCLELGTCLGVSAMYQGAALQLNGKGRLVTIEGSQAVGKIARTNLREAGLESVEVVFGSFREQLLPTLNRIPRLDYVFIDGHHDGTATVEYFRTVVPHLSDRAIVVFDDISWSRGMREGWETIIRSGGICCSVDLFDLGVCLKGSAVSLLPPMKIAV